MLNSTILVHANTNKASVQNKSDHNIKYKLTAGSKHAQHGGVHCGLVFSVVLILMGVGLCLHKQPHGLLFPHVAYVFKLKNKQTNKTVLMMYKVTVAVASGSYDMSTGAGHLSILS